MVGDVVYVGVVPIERKIIHRLVTLFVRYYAHKVPSNGDHWCAIACSPTRRSFGKSMSGRESRTRASGAV
jgi:hypothetical protein